MSFLKRAHSPAEAFSLAVELLKKEEDPTRHDLRHLRDLLKQFNPDEHFVTTEYALHPIHYYTKGDTPGKIAAAQMVLEASRNPDIEIQYAPGHKTPIALVMANYPEILNAYVKKGARIDAPDSRGENILHYISDNTPLDSYRIVTDALGAKLRELLSPENAAPPLLRMLEKHQVYVKILPHDRFELHFSPRKYISDIAMRRFAGKGARRQGDEAQSMPSPFITEKPIHMQERRSHLAGVIKLLYPSELVGAMPVGSDNLTLHADGLLNKQLQEYAANQEKRPGQML